MSRRTFVTMAVLVLIVTVLRVWIGSHAQYPGHDDLSYYYGLAAQLVRGEGWTPSYIWHYLNMPEQLGHLPNDYWMLLRLSCSPYRWPCSGSPSARSS